MPEQFTRIVQKFGGNRVRVLDSGQGYIQFEIAGWASFLLNCDGMTECIGGERIPTNRSQWVQRLSVGMVRDDEGALV